MQLMNLLLIIVKKCTNILRIGQDGQRFRIVGIRGYLITKSL
jgi:hypothetical protein